VLRVSPYTRLGRTWAAGINTSIRIPFRCQDEYCKRAGRVLFFGRIAQLVRAAGLQPAGRGFESLCAHSFRSAGCSRSCVKCTVLGHLLVPATVKVPKRGWPPAAQIPTKGSEVACVGCALSQACPLFTAAATAYQSQFLMNCPVVRPSTESVVPLSGSVVSFSDPPGTSGSGYPSGGVYPA
jgi:hypothetical protein